MATRQKIAHTIVAALQYDDTVRDHGRGQLANFMEDFMNHSLSMQSHVPVSVWIESMKEGDAGARAQLWERYYPQLIRVARQMLQSRARGREAFDEEDVLQSVFCAIFLRCQEGKYPDLDNRSSLWKMLIAMTKNRVNTRVRDANAAKRGGGVKHIPLQSRNAIGSRYFGHVFGTSDRTAESTDEFARTVETVLDGCADLEKQIALYRIQGYEITEIAKLLNKSRSTINRKLSYLKGRLRREFQLG